MTQSSMDQTATTETTFYSEEILVTIIVCGLFIFLFLKIYRCAKMIIDPYGNIDADALSNLEKGTLQSFM
ncbi:unnamed protein product [Clavelina lepadiformis]|uniref:Uncharacterized protein n=1 Tax=Clavelina lepadiformis TaxID=159417 RepID=A0ABP0EV92_CLALP